MARIKGFAIRGLLRFAKGAGIPPAEVVAGLPETVRSSFENPIVHGDFYPYEAFAALLRRIEAIRGKGDGALAHEIGRAAAREDVKGIFRIVTFITSPETAIHRSPVFWSRYCDQGRLVVEEEKPGYFRTSLEGFPDIEPLHCRVLEGWIEGLGELWRAQNVVSKQTACVREGAPRCVIETTWR